MEATMKSEELDKEDCIDYNDEVGKIFIGGLSWDTNRASLYNYFKQFGEITDCVVMKNQLTGRSRGFGFVTFKDPVCVDEVMVKKPHIVDNRQVDPKPCNPRSLNTGGKSIENNKKKVFIGGLPATVTDQHLKEAFAKFGPVLEAVIMYDYARQRSRGFGFVTFEKEDTVSDVVKHQYICVAGKQVEVKRAEPREIHSIADKSIIPELQCIMPTSGVGGNGGAGTASLPNAMAAAMARQLGLPCTPGIQHVLAAQQQEKLNDWVVHVTAVQSELGASNLITVSQHPDQQMMAAQQQQQQSHQTLCVAGASQGAAPTQSYSSLAAHAATTYIHHPNYQPPPNGISSYIGYATQYATHQPQYHPGYISGPMAAAGEPEQQSPPGLLGSYQQEASSFGPARGPHYSLEALLPAGAQPGPAGAAGSPGSGAYMSFTPSVTYTLNPSMTPVPGSVCSLPAFSMPPH